MRNIRMGVPEMEILWNELIYKADNGQLKGDSKATGLLPATLFLMGL